MIHLPTLGRSISPRALRLAARAFITRGRGVCTGCTATTSTAFESKRQCYRSYLNWPSAVESVRQQLEDLFLLQRRRVGAVVGTSCSVCALTWKTQVRGDILGSLGGNVGRPLEVLLLEPELLERVRSAIVLCKVEQTLRRVLDTESARDGLHRFLRVGGVVRNGVRQNDRVGLGVRHAKRAAEGVAQLVVQRHADSAEAGTACPCTEEGVGPAVVRGRVLRDERDRPADRFDALDGEARSDGVRFDRPERLDGVCDRVESGRDGHFGRQRERELAVVNDDLWQDLGDQVKSVGGYSMGG
jgi:hypothetical protein